MEYSIEEARVNLGRQLRSKIKPYTSFSVVSFEFFIGLNLTITFKLFILRGDTMSDKVENLIDDLFNYHQTIWNNYSEKPVSHFAIRSIGLY